MLSLVFSSLLSMSDVFLTLGIGERAIFCCSLLSLLSHMFNFLDILLTHVISRRSPVRCFLFGLMDVFLTLSICQRAVVFSFLLCLLTSFFEILLPLGIGSHVVFRGLLASCPSPH